MTMCSPRIPNMEYNRSLHHYRQESKTLSTGSHVSETPVPSPEASPAASPPEPEPEEVSPDPKPEINLDDLAQIWKSFLNDIPEYIWTSKFSHSKHINVTKDNYPMVDLNKTQTLRHSTVTQIKSKMYSLSCWEINKLFSLGNPTLSEKQGGLTFKDICRYIHSSGRTDIKNKYVPSRFFLHPDSGNNYSVALRRIYYYVN